MALNGLGATYAMAALEAAAGKNPTGTRTLKLYTSTPAYDGTGATECSYPGYVAPTTAAADWGSAAMFGNEARISNANPIVIPSPTSGGPVNVTYGILWNGATLCGMGPVSITLTALAAAPTIPAGSLKLTHNPST